jgi:hypothetical protein
MKKIIDKTTGTKLCIIKHSIYMMNGINENLIMLREIDRYLKIRVMKLKEKIYELTRKTYQFFIFIFVHYYFRPPKQEWNYRKKLGPEKRDYYSRQNIDINENNS